MTDMTVGNFNPFLGTPETDPLFDSPFADDNNNNLQANNLDIIYGLQGDDNISTDDLNFTSDDSAILVGGSGSEQYLVRNNSTVIIADNGNPDSDSDTLLFDSSNSFDLALTVDEGSSFLHFRYKQRYIFISP